jgi:hypothetical protein
MKAQPRPLPADDRIEAMASPANPQATPRALPDELLAELDAAARSLDELYLRGGQLSLELEAQAGTLRIELEDGDGSRLLTPSQLLELLASSPL